MGCNGACACGKAEKESCAGMAGEGGCGRADCACKAAAMKAEPKSEAPGADIEKDAEEAHGETCKAGACGCHNHS